jgi:N-acetyl-alpha-D-muramate 1-phosphate uridylyltransferase
MGLPVAILVGGIATRLRPLTEKIPKALIEINGQPFLAHQLELLRNAGIEEVVICAWYQGEKIQAYAANGSKFGVKINYSFDGDHPLGTGGALKKALPFLGEEFFVLYGDSYLPCDYSLVEQAFFESRKDALMTVFHNKDLGDKSNVQFDNGKILAYDKKNRTPQMEHIDYGLGIFKSEVFADYSEGITFDLVEVYQHLLKKDQLAGYEIADRFYEIGSFAGIKELEIYLKETKGRKTQ